MNWPEALSGWIGKAVRIRIEDQAGHDPIAPPRDAVLHRIEYGEGGSELRFYTGERQYMAVPLADDARPECADGQFRAAVPGAKLVYRVELV